ncbi:MAG: hypothetical protein AVDCRST_MAG93-5642 [uncultured Chloroflexia bacterium]|uniref:Uncharacterized protein n=1 Tax=uncultured Chloroflexia bacterium TaxID=1672391 RepID=A0A6J4L1F3_9CHLR|nr:MAG: hypothetical protein AVDCRST_MAG93-5642 [uncultured Chloroflexia bacterium]
MAITHYQQRTSFHATPPTKDPIVAAERTAEHAAALATLPFPEQLVAQHTAWRRCCYPETRSKADLERFAGLAARLEREGASR